jgi:hypothetical protein
MSSFEENQSISYLGTQNALKSLPVVEQLQDYLIVFKDVGSSSPEVIDNSSFFITYLVDSQGTPIKISAESVALSNLIQNFSDQNEVIIRVDQATSLNKQLEGIHSVTSIGSIVPISYTQTGVESGSNVNYITFTEPGGSTVAGTANYLGVMRKTTNSTYTLSNNKQTVITAYNLPITTASISAAIFKTGSNTGINATGSYTLASSFPSPDLIESITFNITAILESEDSLGFTAGESAPFSIALFRDRGGVVTQLTEQWKTLTYPGGTTDFGGG